MNKVLIILVIIVVLFILAFIAGHSKWHLERNKHNIRPEGNLTKTQGDFYRDEAGVLWELQPHVKNIFHQPDKPVPANDNPYPNVDQTKPYDPNNSNLKFLAKTNSGGSYEAILQPDGTYLEEGPKQATYNYGHPSGLWGSIKHTVLDVIPHFINSGYKSF